MSKLYTFNKETLSYECLKPKTYIKILLYITVGLVMFYMSGLYSGTTQYITRVLPKNILTANTVKFSEDDLIELLKTCNIKYPYIVLAQAKLESSNFTSKIFKENNNMLGMRKARQRVTTAQSEKNTYAYYKNWEDGVYDICFWQNTVINDIVNEDQYFQKLQERYAEDPEYVSKLKSIIKNQKLKSIFEE